MKNISRIISSCSLVFLLTAFESQGQNNLKAGSIAFTSYQSDKDLSNTDNGGTTAFTDRFSILVLNQDGLAGNTVVYFTDNGWNASTGDFIAGTSEGFIKWVVPAGGLAFGAQLYFISKYIDPVTSWGAYSNEAGTTPAGTVTTVSGSNYMELSSGGDQVLAYQTGPTGGPAGNYNNITRRFISAIHANLEPSTTNAGWDLNPAGGHQTSMPPGLTPDNALLIRTNAEVDNGKSHISVYIIECHNLLSRDLYYLSNWVLQDTPFAIGTTAENNSNNIIPIPASSITNNPVDVTRCTGINTSFNAIADYTSNYQWQQNADAAFTNPIDLTNTGLFSGTTTNTLNISNNGTLGGQYFRVIATGYCDPDTSAGALLSLNPITMPAAFTTCTQAATVNNNIYLNSSCELITKTVPAGSNPLTGNVTGQVWIENSVPTYDNQPFVARHYQITPASNTATATGTVNLYFSQADFDAFNAAPGSTLKLPTGTSDNIGKSNLRIGRYVGNSSNGSGLPGSYTGNIAVIVPNSVTWSAVDNRWIVTFNATGFGGFIVQTSAISLPVNLLAFNGRLVNDDTHLQWKTTSETNNDYFDIERSLDGKTFAATGRVTGNNGTSTQTYNWVDAGAAQLPTSKIYYRLKIVSTTGEVEYSTVVIISVSTSGSPVVNVTPNPFTSQININLQLPAATQLTLTLNDVTGKKLKSDYVNAAKGFSTISLSGLSNLTQGIYLLSIQCNGQTYTYKLVK
jgi:hypothetical protein